MGSAHWAAIGILAALRLRDQTGEAQLVQTSLLETGVAWMSYFAAGYFADGTIPGPSGTRHSAMAPYEDFSARDGVIYIAAPNQALFVALCKAIGVEEALEDPRFRSNSDRLAHRDALHALIEGQLRAQDGATWERLLLERGVPCSRLQTIDEVVNDPQVAALDLIREFPHPEIANHRLVDHPITYNGTRAFRTDPAPDLGQHTDAVLRWIGLDPAATTPASTDRRGGQVRAL